MSALLPCPFCGGEASDAGYQTWSKPLENTFWAGHKPITEAFFCNCPRCGVNNIKSVVGYQTQADAIAAWNTRADTVNADLLAALRGFLRWADQKCPCVNEQPNPCTLCGASVENLEACKAADETLPKRLLSDARAAIAKAEGRS